MFILFLDSHKRVRKFIDSLSKDERKRMQYVLITDYDMEDIGDLLPKKASVKVLQMLIPPQTLAIKRLTGGMGKREFQEEYYNYLTRPICRAAITKIVKYAVLENKDVVVCFGLYETDLNVPKYVKWALDNLFPDIRIFDYSDWKDSPSKVINYRPDNIGSIAIQISDYSDQIGRKLMEMESCRDEYSSHNFYNEEDD